MKRVRKAAPALVVGASVLARGSHTAFCPAFGRGGKFLFGFRREPESKKA